MSDDPDRIDVPAVLGERFAIEREIGRGGMATVYVARDSKHDREVALKVLGPEAAAAIGVERFLREIRVAAQLQHAHIVPLYDSGDDRGWLYYVMPVMNGKSLRDRLDREGPLPLDVALRIAREIGGALEYAHRRGLIHRDVKPENILFDGERAVLADFGIARAVGGDRPGSGSRTATGISIGTPGYMSPEQATADAGIDARSDVYSLACVVHEMLTNSRRLRATAEIAANSLTNLRPAAPRPVIDAISMALAENPDDRFSSAEQFVRALDGDVERRRGSTQRRQWLRRKPFVAAVAAAVVALGFFSSRWLRPSSSPHLIGADAGLVTIAIRPFENLGRPDDDYLAEGMVDELIGALARIRGVSVVPRSSSNRFRTADSRTIGSSLNVAWVVEGTVRHAGSQLFVTPSLVEVSSGRTAWSERYEKELQNIRDVQRQIVRTIADTLRLTLLPAPARPESNSDAYLTYQRGRFYWNKRIPAALDTAIIFFNKSLSYDSMYAPAYSGLADAYSLRAWSGVPARKTFPLARTAAERAIALDSMAAPAHASLGFVHIWYDWDWDAGQREIDRAVALDSTYSSAVLFKAWYLIPHGRMDDALAAARRAQRLEPTSEIINTRVGSILAYSHRFAEAETSLRRTLETSPGFPIASAQLARVLAMEGRFPEAIAALPRDFKPLGSFEAGIPGFVYARAGDRARALQQVDVLQARPYQSPDAIAAIYAGLGDRDEAFAWLEKAYQERTMTFVLFAVEPMYDSLRGDPRYPGLISRIRPQK